MSSFDEMVEKHLRACLKRFDASVVRGQVWEAFQRGAVGPSCTELCETIKDEMKKLALTQELVAAYLGIDRAGVSRRFTQQDMSVSELLLILTRLALDLSDFSLPEADARYRAGLAVATTFIRHDLLRLPEAGSLGESQMEQLVRVFRNFGGRPQNGAEVRLLEIWGVSWLVTLWALRPALVTPTLGDHYAQEETQDRT